MMTRQQHALLKLAEEASEVAQRALKAMQFGMDETEPGKVLTNGQRLVLEIRDFQSAHFRLVNMDVLPDNDHESLRDHILAKDAKVDKYYALSARLGQVQP